MHYIDLSTTHATSNGDALTMDVFITYFTNFDNQFNTTGAGIRSSAKIMKALEDAGKKNQSFVALEDSDWELLKAAIDNPSNGYPIKPARFCVPFVDAIKEASKEPPKSVEEGEEKA